MEIFVENHISRPYVYLMPASVCPILQLGQDRPTGCQNTSLHAVTLHWLKGGVASGAHFHPILAQPGEQELSSC